MVDQGAGPGREAALHHDHHRSDGQAESRSLIQQWREVGDVFGHDNPLFLRGVRQHVQVLNAHERDVLNVDRVIVMQQVRNPWARCVCPDSWANATQPKGTRS